MESDTTRTFVERSALYTGVVLDTVEMSYLIASLSVEKS